MAIPKRARPMPRAAMAVVLAAALLVSLPASALGADTAAPAVTGPVLSNSSVSQGAPVGVSMSATDPSGVVSTWVRVDGGSWLRMTPGFVTAVPTTRAGTAAINFGVASVRAGNGFTCALMVGGSVWCWGGNGSGQLGNGTTSQSTLPVAVSGLGSATALATGGSHACARISNGSVRCWGANDNGQLGNGTTSNSSNAVTVSGITGAVAVAAGGSHSCAVLADKTVSCWGSNDFGQLGDGTTGAHTTPVTVSGITNAIGISAGPSHTCAVLSTGGVRCWGYNNLGQLGDGTTDPRLAPVVVSGITTATAVGVGSTHTCARLSNSSIKCWGDNHFGQLGNGTNDDHATPVAVSGITTATSVSTGDGDSCARLSSGTLKCWGNNDSGKLGDGTATDRNAPVTVTGISGAAAVTTAGGHTCARLSDASVRCWGSNGSGELGYSSPPAISTAPVKVSSLSNAASLGTGLMHSCAVLTDHSIRCWGRNRYGGLGDGTENDSATPVQVAGITTGLTVDGGSDWPDSPGSTCALLSDHTVKCWGQGAGVASSTPVTISGTTTATNLSVGEDHACVVLADLTARCWGRNQHGQLGDGTTYDRSAPVKVYGLSNVVSIAATDAHTCAVIVGGGVKCWGDNAAGELGDGTTTQRLTPVSVSGIATATQVGVGEEFSCALLADATVQCWGSNGFRRLGNPGGSSATPIAIPGLANVVSLAVGFDHSCAALSGGTVSCWGVNFDGQLGIGKTSSGELPTPVLGIGTAVEVATGGYTTSLTGAHSCARLADRTVRCWGDNRYGQLGAKLGGTLPARPPLDSVIGTLAAGTHQVCVRATDTAGNTSDGTACATLTVVDKTGPTSTAPVTTLREGAALSSGSLRVTVAWTATDNAGGVGVDHYELASSVDGGTTWTTVNSALTVTSANLTLPTDTTRRFRIRAYDKANNVGAWATGPVIEPHLIDETDPGITYTGTWSTVTSSLYSGGTDRSSSTAGDSASYSFTGTSVAYVTSQSTTHGAVKIYVDGTLSATVDTYSATSQTQLQVWAKSWTKAGTHTIKLVVVGTAGRPRVDLDAFAVFGTTVAAPPPTGSGPTPTLPNTAGSTLDGPIGGQAPPRDDLALILFAALAGGWVLLRGLFRRRASEAARQEARANE